MQLNELQVNKDVSKARCLGVAIWFILKNIHFFLLFLGKTTVDGFYLLRESLKEPMYT